jgi:hypothetical protein
MRKIFHLEKKAEMAHRYYGSLSELFKKENNIGISKFSLDRWDWTNAFENDICIIRKSNIQLSKRVAKKTQAKKRTK